MVIRLTVGFGSAVFVFCLLMPQSPKVIILAVLLKYMVVAGLFYYNCYSLTVPNL